MGWNNCSLCQRKVHKERKKQLKKWTLSPLCKGLADKLNHENTKCAAPCQLEGKGLYVFDRALPYKGH